MLSVAVPVAFAFDLFAEAISCDREYVRAQNLL
jgi:hypothetical protein